MTEERASSAHLARLRPLGHTRLYEEVIRGLLEYVRESGLKPGDRLPTERELARGMAVSRASIRQATLALEVRGVIEVRHGHGTYLLHSRETLDEILQKRARIQEVLEAREALEVKLAGLAARRASKADHAAIQEALDLMTEEISNGRIGVEGDAAFHRAVSVAAHSGVLAELMYSLRDAIGETRIESLSEPGRPPKSLDGHRSIAEAIKRGDSAGAELRMSAHLHMVADVRLMAKGT